MGGVKIIILFIWLTIHRQNADCRRGLASTLSVVVEETAPHVRRTPTPGLAAGARFFPVVGGARIHRPVGGLLGESSRFGLLAKRAVAALKQYRRRQGQG